MKIKFDTNTFTVPANEQGLYHATTLSQAWAEAGGQTNALKGWMATLGESYIAKFQLCTSKARADRGGGTWVNKRGLLAFAAYCSEEFEDAVYEAFIALTEGNGSKAAAIAESVAISPELITKYDDTRETMVALIKELEDAGKIKLGGYGVSTFSKLACKAAAGYAPAELTGKNGSAKNYIVDAEHAEGLSGMIAVMESIIRGLRMGLDYHQIAALMNVETSKNGNMLDYSLAA